MKCSEQEHGPWNRQENREDAQDLRADEGDVGVAEAPGDDPD